MYVYFFMTEYYCMSKCISRILFKDNHVYRPLDATKSKKLVEIFSNATVVTRKRM